MSDALVIVGASLAGVKAAEGARNAGWTGPIRLVGAEPHLPYERPPLSKGVLAGREAPVSALVHGDGYEAAHDVDLLLGVTVTAIDASEHTVTLGSSGRALRYDKLVLATGSTPRRLDLPGGSLPEVLTLRTIDDSLALLDRLFPGRRTWTSSTTRTWTRRTGCVAVCCSRA